MTHILARRSGPYYRSLASLPRRFEISQPTASVDLGKELLVGKLFGPAAHTQSHEGPETSAS